MFYDGLLLAALWFITTAVILAASGGQLASTDRSLALLIFQRICLVLITVLFFAGFWTHGGQTLGMRAWRLKLVNRGGSDITWKLSLLRLAAAIPSIGIFGLGLFWALFDPAHRALHDRLSGTDLIILAKKA